MYRLLIYRSSMQRTAPQVHFDISLQYRNAAVGAETEIRPQQYTATQLQWTMNTASVNYVFAC